MSWNKRKTLAIISVALGAATLRASSNPNAEFIRVASDQWSFETRTSKTRFIPFGVNFVLNEKRYLNLFGPGVYDPKRYERALTSLEQLGFNTVKVFLPIGQVLPDPQRPGPARIASGYLDNLDEFLGLAHRHHIRVVVCLACWGGNEIRWWHEGGEYFGRAPWRNGPGIDSLEILSSFWAQLGARLRDNPTVLSYTPAVEWGFPASNLTWTPPGEQVGRLVTEPGVFFWRAFLRARYKSSIAKLNQAYGTHYTSFEQVPVVDFTYDFKAKRYVDPVAKLLDYQNFREWASWRYFKPQIAAIRAADPRHMVTISNHSRRAIGLWEGAAGYACGFEVPEQSELVDYFTTHDNRSQSELKRGATIQDVVHDSILQARFCNARARKPLVIEEFTFAAPAPQRVAEGQAEMVLGTVGHASGWMNWYLQYPHSPNGADFAGGERSAVLDDDFRPTPWGLRAHELIEQLRTLDLSRLAPVTTLDLERQAELVPLAAGTQLRICRQWTNYVQPIDFRWPRNQWLDLRISGTKTASPTTDAPGVLSDGDSEIGPDYRIDPDLTDQGKPKGRSFEFTMALADSKIFRGDDLTLQPEKKPVRKDRRVYVYIPAAYKDGTKAPLLIIHDGPGQLNLVRNALDNLTISKDPNRRLPAFIAIAVQNGGNDGKKSERGLEYDTLSDRLARFINDGVLPAVLDNAEIKTAYPQLQFTADPWGRAVMGCSSGGAAALTMGWFHPDLFRRLIAYSGTFVAQQDEDAPEARQFPLGAWEYHSGMKLIETTERKPLRIFTQVSENDLRANDPEETHHNWVTAGRRTAEALQTRGYAHRFVFSHGTGHCDHRVFEQTLADTLVWIWRGYPPN